MIRLRPLLLALPAVLLLSGCIRTAASIVTAPVRIASKGVDWATTSQSESDENRGREIRRREERLGKLQRSYDKHMRQCQAGDQGACRTARTEYEQLQDLMPSVPYERR